MTKKNDSPAFPVCGTDGVWATGISVRQYYAAAALQGLLARDTVRDEGNNNLAKWAVMNPQNNFKEQSKRCFEWADAMIEAEGSENG